MPAAKYSEEFKAQVVREVVEKDRTIASVAASYDLVAQTVGKWVARYRKEHATDQDEAKMAESAEIAKLRAENRELRQENEFLPEKSSRLACEGTTVTERYERGAAKKAAPLFPRCAGGQAYRNRDTTPGATDPSQQQLSGGKSSGSWLTTPLRTLMEYGYRRICRQLRRRGVVADGATVRSIMRELGLRAAQPRAKVRTTVPVEDLDKRPDLLRRDFSANEPGKKLCGDMSVSAPGQGSCIWRLFWTADALKVVGYAMADHMRTSLVCEAIDMAVRRCPIEKDVTVFPLRQGKSVYVSEVSGPPQVLWYSPPGGAYGGVLGQCVGGVF